MQAEAIVGLDAEPRRSALGCLPFLAAPAIGLVLGLAQTSLLIRTWMHCEGQPLEVAVDTSPGGGADVGLVPLVARVLVYGAALLVGVVAANAVAKSPSRRRRMAVIWTAGLLCCVMAFAVDYTLCNGLDSGTYLKDVCPGGHPKWWPF